MNTIDEIKARIDIVDLVSETVKLRHSGKNYTGFCPFHPNAHTPAFAVFPDSGTWRCFGQCNEGGDIFKYIMKKEGFDFTQALKYLAERAGVQLQPQTPETEAQAEEFDRLRTLLEEAVVFYRHQLLHTSAGQAALDYLHRRGLRDETIEVFGLGYGPDAWEAAVQHFTSKGYTPDELLQVGLVTQRDAARGVYDRFRNRIIFPIREGTGKMAGFGARISRPQRPAQVYQHRPDGALRQRPLALRPGPGAQGRPRPGPGGHRGRLPGRDRPAPGRLRQHRLADGYRPHRGPAPPGQEIHPAHHPGVRRRCRR